ncbi:glycohydrolase toxin TNT-related protein [Rhodococcus erythropolis]|uniref:glycohydrolase toxin TNT-related protein n=1 Tax=Rhodococcus erythropolis TaxID=1833 RepID=UPI0030137782
MKSALKLKRPLAGFLAAGALLTGTAGVIGAGLALTAGPAHATPEEDCVAVRARDHQIYLNLIASLPPGSPIPPEIINPCLSAPSTTATAAPTTTVGLPGAQAPGGGPNVGANAPTNFPTYNGTPIVPVPGAAQPGQPQSPTPPAIENPAGVPVPSTASGPAPATPQPAGSTAPTVTADRGPGPVPTETPNTAPGQHESTPTVTNAELSEDDGRDRYLELVLVGAAAFTAAGIGVRGRPGPFSPRTPESVLSQVVGTIASPLMAYSPGGQSSLRVFDPIADGYRFFFLIHDQASSHESVIPVTVPPGGHMSVNPDGTVTVFDADGNLVSTIDAPWAYDANGTPIPTHYEIRDGQLVQVVDTAGIENILYPILADPLYGGDNVASGQSMTATALPNGQEAISGQPDGVAVVGTPDPGYTAYVPNQDTMKPGSEMTVDQGDGTTNRYDNPVDSGDAELEVTTVPTTEALDTMAAAQEDANQESAVAAAQAKDDRDEWLRETAAERARDDWFSEQGSILSSLFRFSQNVRGANGIDGLAEAGSDLLGLGKSVAQAVVAYNQDPSGTTRDVLESALRLDALREEGPQYWYQQIQLDAGAAVLTGPFAEAGLGTRVASTATRVEAGIARTAADDVIEGIGRTGVDAGATAPVKPPATAPVKPPTTSAADPGLAPGRPPVAAIDPATPTATPALPPATPALSPSPKPTTGVGAYPDPAGIDPQAVRLFPPDATPYGPGGTLAMWEATFIDPATGRWGWPDHQGFVIDSATGKPIYELLPQFPPGAAFDRFGKPRGEFLGADGDIFPARSLPPQNAVQPYYQYVLDQPLPPDLAVLTGRIAPEYAAPGGGTQFLVVRIDDTTGLPILTAGSDYTDINTYSRLTIQEMLRANIIRQIYPPPAP